jgi:hypothetical protein
MVELSPMSIVRAVVPPRARRWLRRVYGARHFDAAMRRFAADPQAAVAPGSSVLVELITAWGNTGWSAQEEYLRVCITQALNSNGPTLECGSGLSTLLLGVVAQRNGFEHWALEHEREWSVRVHRAVKRYRLSAVRVSTAPLKHYTGFDWYDPPLQEMPAHFAMVVCDGPPTGTLGGRYGLVPVMRERLQPGCVILLDDAWREDERAVARRWQAELDSTHELVACKKPYIRMVVTGSFAPRVLNPA